MSYDTLVMTCGISLLSRFNHYGLPKDQALDTWRAYWRHRPLDQHLPTPSKVSAEYSMLHAVRRQLAPRARVALLYTPTPQGQACAWLLEQLLRQDFKVQVELVTLDPLDVADAKALRRGLGRYMATVRRQLAQSDPRHTLFAPIGGYKVMTSLGYLAGAFQGYSSAYLHENSQVLHLIPAVPVRVDTEVLEEVAATMKRVGEAAALEDLDPAQREHVEDTYSWLFEHQEGLVSVNAVGEHLMQLPENAHLFATQIAHAPKALPTDTGELRFAEQQLAELIKRLRHGTVSESLCHDWARPVEGWHVYKGASNGRWVFRALYTYRPERDLLGLAQVWLNHDLYMREAKAKSLTLPREVPAAWARISSPAR